MLSVSMAAVSVSLSNMDQNILQMLSFMRTAGLLLPKTSRKCDLYADRPHERLPQCAMLFRHDWSSLTPSTTDTRCGLESRSTAEIRESQAVRLLQRSQSGGLHRHSRGSLGSREPFDQKIDVVLEFLVVLNAFLITATATLALVQLYLRTYARHRLRGS